MGQSRRWGFPRKTASLDNLMLPNIRRQKVLSQRQMNLPPPRKIKLSRAAKVMLVLSAIAFAIHLMIRYFYADGVLAHNSLFVCMLLLFGPLRFPLRDPVGPLLPRESKQRPCNSLVK